MKTTVIVAVALTLLYLILSDLVLAQNSGGEEKLDTILVNQELMLSNQKKILKEVTYVDPLADKAYGVEFNPGYLLLSSASDDIVLSGGFSLFSVNRSAEIAFPVYYRVSTDSKDDVSMFILDAQFRRFLGDHQNGFFLSGGLRYARLSGKEDLDGIPIVDLGPAGKDATANKFGATFGIGYRYFSKSGFYWGASLNVGRYFTDTDINIRNIHLDDGKALFDVELLKIGYAF